MSLDSAIATVRARLRVAWSDAEYGRKRMLEVRTGHTYTEETRRRKERAEISALYAAFDAEPVSWGPDGERDPLDAPDEDRRDDRSRLDGP